MIDKKIRKKIENAFYNYSSLKQQGAEYLVELAEAGLTAKYDSVGGRASGDNTTETRCVKAVDSNRAVQWCRVVEKTLEHFRDTGKDTLIRLRYFEHLKLWKCGEKLYISESALKLWINDILDYAFAVSAYLHLIKINDF